jgi:hypothetical protein
MTIQYSLYILHNFFPEDHVNHLFFKHYFYEYKLDHPWFSGRFFLAFLNYYNFWSVWGYVAPDS